MSRHRGEFQLSTLDRFYPFHVAVLIHRESQRERFTFYGELDAFYGSMNEAPRFNGIGRGETEHIIYGFKTDAAAQTVNQHWIGTLICMQEGPL